MAHIPSFEETLSQIRKSMGLKRNSQEVSFSKFELSIQGSVNLTQNIIEEILSALDMGDQASLDALGNLNEWVNFNKSLELNIWTGRASQQQILWHMLAYVYVPVFARRFAFWSLHNIQHCLPAIDEGMPGGKFWFLPFINQESATLEMPVKQVLDWLIDFSGRTSIAGLLADSASEKKDSYIRTLHNWMKGTVPKSANLIDEIFSDEFILSAEGTFKPNVEWTLEDGFIAALDFIRVRGLDNPSKLNSEIPLSQERLEALFNGNGTDTDKDEFIKQVATRYSRPHARVIRQRLKAARLMQDGYLQLLSFLCPDVTPDCQDPTQNKLLQLLSLFQTVYNLTIQAYNVHPTSDEQQDAWFDSKLAPLDKADLLMAIAPSTRQSASSLLAERLTRKFVLLAPDAPLENLVPWSPDLASRIIENRIKIIKDQHDEDVRLRKLKERIRVASPWRALLNENSFWVLSQLAGQQDLSPRILRMVFNRMREIAENDSQLLQVNLMELGWLLDSEPNSRPHEAKQRTQKLIDDSERSVGFDVWKAPLLRMRAKHRLFQNDFPGAIRDFKAALKACSEGGFGGLRGKIAREGFATELIENGFIPENHEIYYRNLLAFTQSHNETLSFEDAAVECEDFFWDTLYQPYTDVEPEIGFSRHQYKAITEETTEFIANADWGGLALWLDKNAKNYRGKRIRDARRNSLLLGWLKFLSSQEKMLPRLKLMMPVDIKDQLVNLEQLIINHRQSIAVLLKAWPEQANISDFKGQTPLMLVAADGDTELTKILIPFSDINARDCLGRTALHAAVTSNAKACVSAILECETLDVTEVTNDGNSALHMSVRFGFTEVVELILEAFPGSGGQANHAEETPQSIAISIHENYTSWKGLMQQKGRQVGTKSDFEKIIAKFETLKT